MDWNRYPNFAPNEFKCSHCGKVEMQPAFMEQLQLLRTIYGKPMRITSGYRCPEHPVEARKSKPGAHSEGCAADIGVVGPEAHAILRLALENGFTGIGVQQKGEGRFIHVDTSTTGARPSVWSY